LSPLEARLAEARALPLEAGLLGYDRLKRISIRELAGPCPVCGGDDRFAINSQKRRWLCRQCKPKGGGDTISLAMHIGGLSFLEAIERLTGERPEPSAAAPRAGVERAAADAARNLASARRIVRELVPIRGTPGERYLAQIRKIDTDAIADVLERSDAIGWHPKVFFREEGHPLDGQCLWCIVGIMTDVVTARPTGAISRTYIGPDGTKVGKAKTLGTPAGIVRLTPDEDVASSLHLAEGLETALDAMAIGLRPMWSTGSKGLMATFPLLSGIECLTIVADHDRGGAGEAAAHDAASRWRRAGGSVRILRPAAYGDLNDMANERTDNGPIHLTRTAAH
jgi:phage/plasmid primase-like uncharacterized protein